MIAAGALARRTVDVLAHQGGWDEALLVVVPIAGLAGLLWLAARRAGRAQNDDARPGGDA